MQEFNHDELRKTWKPGQYWETRIGDTWQWIPVGNGGYAEPLWDKHQEYRQSQPVANAAPVLSRDEVRDIFLRHGFTVKEGQADLKPYVYEAADTLMRETARRLRGW